MEQRKDFDLINTTFDPVDARDLLVSMLDSKINYHVIKNLSNQERYGMKDEHSLRRINELKQSWMEISQLLDDAQKAGIDVFISSSIKIETKPQVKETTYSPQMEVSRYN
jgi:hypothetical protein